MNRATIKLIVSVLLVLLVCVVISACGSASDSNQTGDKETNDSDPVESTKDSSLPESSDMSPATSNSAPETTPPKMLTDVTYTVPEDGVVSVPSASYVSGHLIAVSENYKYSYNVSSLVKNSEIKNLNYIASEYAFNLRIDEYWLTGRIDALFETGDDYIILDWKTGESFSPENVKFQTTFYLFCMYEILKAKKYLKEPKQLSLYYMDLYANSLVKIHFDDDLYIKYKSQILDIINKINNSANFFCNKTDKCKQCKYYRACPYL